MVIVHISENQRRVISSLKGETVEQLCHRFCKEFNYPVSQFEFYSISSKQPLPGNLSASEIKEVRLVRISDGRKGSQDSCYSSIDEHSPLSSIGRKAAPLPQPPQHSPAAATNKIDRIVKRNAPPPPTYKLSPDTSLDDADIYIPAPPTEPIPCTEMEAPLFVTSSADCCIDRVPSPRICLPRSNNSSSVDSSEEAFTPVRDYPITMNDLSKENTRTSDSCTIGAVIDESSDEGSINVRISDSRSYDKQLKDKIGMENEKNKFGMENEKKAVMEEMYSTVVMEEVKAGIEEEKTVMEKEMNDVVGIQEKKNNEIKETKNYVINEEKNKVVMEKEKNKVVIEEAKNKVVIEEEKNKVVIEEEKNKVVMKEEKTVMEKEKNKVVVIQEKKNNEIKETKNFVINEEMNMVTNIEDKKAVIEDDARHYAALIEAETQHVQLRSPVCDSMEGDGLDETDKVVVSTNIEPIAAKKQFWEPVKATKQLVFTSRKSTSEDSDVAVNPVVRITPVAAARTVNVMVKEQVQEKTGRPEFVPVRPRSLFFSAGTK